MKTSVVEAPALDPFQASDFIHGHAAGRALSAHAVRVSLQQRRKEPIVVDAPGEAVHALVVLNGKPHAVIDWKGAIGDALVLEMAVKATKQAPARHGLQPGTNELLLIPFHAERAQVDRLAKSLRAFASVQVLDGDEARWAFAKWQPPMRGPHNWTPAKAAKGSDPRWFMACFEGPAGKKGAAQASTDSTMELLCDGLSRGHVLVNGELVGAYDLEAGRDSVTLPAERLNESNELLIFDAEGRMPTGVRIRR